MLLPALVCPAAASPVPPPSLSRLQLCSGRHRHIPVCEVMVCVLALLWWIGCSITGGWRGRRCGHLPARLVVLRQPGQLLVLHICCDWLCWHRLPASCSVPIAPCLASASVVLRVCCTPSSPSPRSRQSPVCPAAVGIPSLIGCSHDLWPERRRLRQLVGQWIRTGAEGQGGLAHM